MATFNDRRDGKLKSIPARSGLASVTSIQSARSKREDKCSCGEPDVYDGWAQCEVHPDGGGE